MRGPPNPGTAYLETPCHGVTPVVCRLLSVAVLGDWLVHHLVLQ